MGEASEVVIPLFGVLDITGEVLLMWAICLVLVVVSAVATRRLRERPGRLQNVLETGIEYLDGFFTGLLGKRAARKYFYFLGSLFIFIIFSNYSGLIPGVGLTPYFKAPTSSLSVTVGLGLLAFVFCSWRACARAAGAAISNASSRPWRSCCRCWCSTSSSSPRRSRCVCSATSLARRP